MPRSEREAFYYWGFSLAEYKFERAKHAQNSSFRKEEARQRSDGHGARDWKQCNLASAKRGRRTAERRFYDISRVRSWRSETYSRLSARRWRSGHLETDTPTSAAEPSRCAR